MSAVHKLVKGTLFLSTCTGVGVLLRFVVAPSEERKREILKDLSESNPQQMSETRQHNILIMQPIKEAAETNENLARRTPWSK